MKHPILYLAIYLGCLCGTLRAEGLTYFDGDPYQALAEARRQRKMLIVEFYAQWSHKSRWMSEKVLNDSTLRPLIEENFLVSRVETDTPEGGSLAVMYEVTDYPVLVIFSSNGDVLDKIDKALDREDFEQRLQALLIAVHGGDTWQLRLAYAAAEQGDRVAADAHASQFLSSQASDQVINSVVWPMFENSMITYYYSTAFGYLLAHIDRFREEIGAERVDQAVTDVLLNGMLPYVVGSAPYSADIPADIVSIASDLGLTLPQERLALAAQVAEARASGDLSVYIAGLSRLLDEMPEWMVFPLTLSLDVVAREGSRTEKTAARRVVDRVITAGGYGRDTYLLEELRDRLN